MAPLPCLRGDRGIPEPHILLLWDTDPLISRLPAAAVAVILSNSEESVPTIVLNPDTEFLTGGSFCPCCWSTRQGTPTFPSGLPGPTALPLPCVVKL